MNFFTRLQSKSSDVKAQYAFVFASLITGLIGVVWMSTLSTRFSEFTASKPGITEDPNSLNDFVGEAKSQLGNVIDSTKENIINEIQPTTNLNSLGEPEVTEDSVGEGLNPVTPTSLAPIVNSEIVATSTLEIQPERADSRMILIGTTTSKQSTSTL